ncbi:MAG: hypothetical protein QOI38_2332 [Sphingomonadales bacterium]|jgi:hypothetical protein|nr:hypothetical protein [Sphingomonadales bacterium]
MAVTVIPAEAGISGRIGTVLLAGTPAFARVTACGGRHG